MNAGARVATMALALLPGVMPPAQAAPIDPAKSLELSVKAAFLYKFGLFITWPAAAFASPASPFTLCVVGGDPFGPLLDRAVSGQHYGGRDISISRIPTLTPESRCDLAYVAAANDGEAARQLAIAGNRPVLTVTDLPPGATAKGIINFVVEDDHVRFEIDNAAAMDSGLSISSKLLSLAVTAR